MWFQKLKVFSWIEITMRYVYCQYGAGSEAVPGWLSFDSSPTLRLQRFPIIGKIIRGRLNCVFDVDIKYGDIVKGLPLADESVDVVFASHVLEHLALDDFYTALKNTKKILKSGGIFRVIVPDLRQYVDSYLKAYSSSESEKASILFCLNTGMGITSRNKTLKRFLVEYLGNSSHRWMWDEKALSFALSEAGFVDIKRFYKGQTDSNYLLINQPERIHQFERAIALQCKKNET